MIHVQTGKDASWETLIESNTELRLLTNPKSHCGTVSQDIKISQEPS